MYIENVYATLEGGSSDAEYAEREAMRSRRSGGVPRENRRPANIRIEEGAYRAPHPLLEKFREWNWCRIILCVAAIYALSGIGLKLITIVSQKHKQVTLLEQQAALEQQVEDLEQQEAYVGTEEYIEQAAREKFGWVKEDEIIFRKKNAAD